MPSTPQINEARAETESDAKAKAVADKKRKKVAHMMNLNEDPMLSGVVLHYMDSETTTIGRGDAEPPPSIALKGLSISKNHAVIQKKGKNLEIRPGTQVRLRYRKKVLFWKMKGKQEAL